ncbi:MAG: F0F1 ATP synthase subunit B [Gammaproteobacteria bacterium]|nr:F0F1 ATP synthase subunit B [Gammaproteobacteria bacterium]
MSINVTLLVQMIVFILLVWFTMTYVWPIIRGAMDERENKIADGLAAAEKGQSDLVLAKEKADKILLEAKSQAKEVLDQASLSASNIAEEARANAENEMMKKLEAAQSEIEVEINRAKDQLREQVASIALAGAEKVLKKEIDQSDHKKILEDLAQRL